MLHKEKEMGKQKQSTEKQAAFIRSDGWVISADGMKRLKECGHKGHDRFMESMKSQIGEWHRVSKPLDREAAEIVKSVKGMVARAVFVSKAIVNEAERRVKKESKNG